LPANAGGYCLLVSHKATGSPLPGTMQVTPMDIEEESGDIKMGDTESFTIVTNASEEEEARQAIDMLRGEDVSARVAAANRLEAVAAALGEERTRDELLPFITDGVDDEDEVLVAIAS
jgi:hypothetical protein